MPNPPAGKRTVGFKPGQSDAIRDIALGKRIARIRAKKQQPQSPAPSTNSSPTMTSPAGQNTGEANANAKQANDSTTASAEASLSANDDEEETTAGTTEATSGHEKTSAESSKTRVVAGKRTATTTSTHAAKAPNKKSKPSSSSSRREWETIGLLFRVAVLTSETTKNLPALLAQAGMAGKRNPERKLQSFTSEGRVGGKDKHVSHWSAMLLCLFRVLSLSPCVVQFPIVQERVANYKALGKEIRFCILGNQPKTTASKRLYFSGFQKELSDLLQAQYGIDRDHLAILQKTSLAVGMIPNMFVPAMTTSATTTTTTGTKESTGLKQHDLTAFRPHAIAFLQKLLQLLDPFLLEEEDDSHDLLDDDEGDPKQFLPLCNTPSADEVLTFLACSGYHHLLWHPEVLEILDLLDTGEPIGGMRIGTTRGVREYVIQTYLTSMSDCSNDDLVSRDLADAVVQANQGLNGLASKWANEDADDDNDDGSRTELQRLLQDIGTLVDEFVGGHCIPKVPDRAILSVFMDNLQDSVMSGSHSGKCDNNDDDTGDKDEDDDYKTIIEDHGDEEEEGTEKPEEAQVVEEDENNGDDAPSEAGVDGDDLGGDIDDSMAQENDMDEQTDPMDDGEEGGFNDSVDGEDAMDLENDPSTSGYQPLITVQEAVVQWQTDQRKEWEEQLQHHQERVIALKRKLQSAKQSERSAKAELAKMKERTKSSSE